MDIDRYHHIGDVVDKVIDTVTAPATLVQLLMQLFLLVRFLEI